MADITQYPELIVKQQVEHLEIFTGFEMKNRYAVLTPEGENLLYAFEESGFLGRQFLRKNRPLTIHVVDNAGQEVFSARRGFFLYFSHLHVADGGGRPLGSLRRRFSVFNRRFTLDDAHGQQVGAVRGPLFRPNTFFIHQQGGEVARVTKQWSGLLKEAMSDADTFRVSFATPARDQDFTHLVLATALAIDLSFFESGGRSGISFSAGR